MTAVLSPQHSSPSSQPAQSPPLPSSTPSLPPLVTSSSKRSNLQRPPSYAKHRLSGYSNISNPSQNPSRPASHVFPLFHSSLSYTSVRDFAYPVLHPLHYGPPPEPSTVGSGTSTPLSESQRRLSDPPFAGRDGSSAGWFAGPWGGDGSMLGEQTVSYVPQDGPPYSEDEDLHSPVVTSTRQHAKHKKHKSSFETYKGSQRPGHPRGSGLMAPQNLDSERGYFAGTRPDGSETYYINDDDAAADGPGGEFVTYPPDQARHSMAAYNVAGQRDSHFAATLPSRSYAASRAYDADEVPPSASSPGFGDDDDDSRYSRDYQFTIASPDEEMHGKAVALFDFARENENELPLVEGQIIWVSYRHGQGWLVAEDPKTQESGLVPEEYVRLLRDIQGGLGSLTGDLNDNILSPQSGAPEAITPTYESPERSGHEPQVSTGSNGSNGFHRPPIVSTFSTSSKDLDPFPPHLLGTQQGQAPPQVVHYHGQPGGSQANTPTLTSPMENLLERRSSSKSRSQLQDVTNRPASGVGSPKPDEKAAESR
ncbi:MAG: HOG (high osmolarity glycerol) pathway protein [Chaenotheca gracillima]|nr:MAG: HOG (high osmolarity glycerol) pathway protein [Chaenotheca gracillima]